MVVDGGQEDVLHRNCSAGRPASQEISAVDWTGFGGTKELFWQVVLNANIDPRSSHRDPKTR